MTTKSQLSDELINVLRARNKGDHYVIGYLQGLLICHMPKEEFRQSIDYINKLNSTEEVK